MDPSRKKILILVYRLARDGYFGGGKNKNGRNFAVILIPVSH